MIEDIKKRPSIGISLKAHESIAAIADRNEVSKSVVVDALLGSIDDAALDELIATYKKSKTVKKLSKLAKLSKEELLALLAQAQD